MPGKNPVSVNKILVLVPVFGSLFFVILYFIATLYYPGGSQADIHSKGFSWMNNYWCNLLNTNAMNGQPNPARLIAMIAMIVLCFSLGVFWYHFPKPIGFKRNERLLIQISGMVPMIFAILIFTDFHDIVIDIASLSGLIALTGTFIGLFRLKWIKLVWLGGFNVLLILVNNILYYGHDMKLYLPIIQKITFISFLFWICLININLYRKQD